jgi:hypothetical protein
VSFLRLGLVHTSMTGLMRLMRLRNSCVVRFLDGRCFLNDRGRNLAERLGSRRRTNAFPRQKRRCGCNHESWRSLRFAREINSRQLWCSHDCYRRSGLVWILACPSVT